MFRRVSAASSLDLLMSSLLKELWPLDVVEI